MLKKTRQISAALALAMTASAAVADSVTWEMIPWAASANDMSPDGRWVVGNKVYSEGGGPYLWNTVTNEVFDLPSDAKDAVAVSDDGTVVLGNRYDAQGHEYAVRWTAASGVWTSLGALDHCDSFYSSGHELSGDGSVAVGLTWAFCSGRGFRWTEATGMMQLQPLALGGNRASVVSTNGSVIGGFAQGLYDRTPCIWGSSGAGTLLDPPNGAAQGEVFGMNDSGTILLGIWNQKAVRWTSGGLVRTQIGLGSALPGWQGIPLDIANSGTTVGFDILGGNRRAWIQLNGSGPILDLHAYVIANGGWIPEDDILEVCQAISNDGTKIIGHGFSGAWIVRNPLPGGCPADLSPIGGDGAVDGADLGVVLGAWGTPGADLNGDGTTDGADLGIVLGAWGACASPIGACCLGSECAQLTLAECEAASGSFAGAGVPCSLAGCAFNDHCAQAVDVTGSINGSGMYADNSAATPGAYSGADPELPEGSPSCQWEGQPLEAHSTVWFKFTAPLNGKITANTCNSTPAPFVDSTLTVYSGTCGNFVEIGCGEDTCGAEPVFPYYSSVTLEGLTPGETYYICVMNSGGWLGSVPGPFVLSLSSPFGP